MLVVRREDNVIRLIETDPPEFGSLDWLDYDPNYWHLTGGPCAWEVMMGILMTE